MSSDVISTTLSTIGSFINMVKNYVFDYYDTKSLPEITKLTRVEPLTIISKDLLTLEYMKDINNSLLNIFAGYYLQAVSILTTINDVEVVRLLDSLNPDRDSTGFLLSNPFSLESIDTFVSENYEHRLPTRASVALEASSRTGTPGTADNQDRKSLNEMSNLSVGKLLNVEINYTHRKDEFDTGENRAVKVPIAIRLMVSIIPTSTIIHLLSIKKEDSSFIERYHKWRSGRISFIKDLIFCQDIIDEYKKAIISDETNTMQEIMKRVNNSKKYGLLTKNPSLVSASNIFIITETDAMELENKLGGKLSNARIRQKAFDSTYAMLLVVVDRDRERVIIYSRNMETATNLSIKEIVAVNKNKGPDVLDILKSYQSSTPISF